MSTISHIGFSGILVTFDKSLDFSMAYEAILFSSVAGTWGSSLTTSALAICHLIYLLFIVDIYRYK